MKDKIYDYQAEKLVVLEFENIYKRLHVIGMEICSYPVELPFRMVCSLQRIISDYKVIIENSVRGLND